MSSLLRGTAVVFTAITVVLCGDLVLSVAGYGRTNRWIIISCEIAMLVGVILTGVGTLQSLRRGRPDRDVAERPVVASRLYGIALCFFVVSSLIFVAYEAAFQLDPDGLGSDPNFAAGAVLVLGFLGLLIGSILAVIASYQWLAHARRARAR